MVEYGYFAHYNPVTGFGPPQALAQVDYDWTSWGENIGRGYQTPASMLIGFLSSDSGHRESVMGQGSIPQTFREIGVGHHASSNTWTVILARPGNTEPALTGVVYDDKNNNNRMDLGEGAGRCLGECRLCNGSDQPGWRMVDPHRSGNMGSHRIGRGSPEHPASLRGAGLDQRVGRIRVGAAPGPATGTLRRSHL